MQGKVIVGNEQHCALNAVVYNAVYKKKKKFSNRDWLRSLNIKKD